METETNKEFEEWWEKVVQEKFVTYAAFLGAEVADIIKRDRKEEYREAWEAGYKEGYDEGHTEGFNECLGGEA